MSTVKVGQVWADNDKRSEGRYVRVKAVEPAVPARPHHRAIPERAVVIRCDSTGEVIGKPRLTRIRTDRFVPTTTGYRLVRPSS